MRITLFVFFLVITGSINCYGSESRGKRYRAGFTTVHLTDSSRTYKPGTGPTDPLHYRPIDIDIWYPSSERGTRPLLFNSLLGLYEKRVMAYQDDIDYTGLVKELAEFYVSELGIGTDGRELLDIETDSYANLKATSETHPVIIYMAGPNGMGFENFKVLEHLAQNGFIVLSVSSIGRYPGNMQSTKEDMMEQVFDAEFILKYADKTDMFDIDMAKVGILGYGWGGMGAAVLLNRNPDIVAMVSFDGSETYYFGETDGNVNAGADDREDRDSAIKKIQDDGLLNPEDQNVAYLYFESGDKLYGFTPNSEFNYHSKLNSDKYYLRFKNSGRSFFVCIPYILNASKDSVNVYRQLQTTTVNFFNKNLRGVGGFEDDWNKLISLDYTTVRPYNISVN